MSRHAFRALFALGFAILVLSSCGYVGEWNSGAAAAPIAPVARSILVFQSASETLALPRLQVGGNVYTDVNLHLGKDGSWGVRSIGGLRPLASGESVQAVLTAPANAVIDTAWRPADATITISRLHIDDKVYGNVPLHLTGDTWAWGGTLKELSALTMADFAANPKLVATEAHHVVLESAPENGTQSYPMRLSAKVYKFCMDKQNDGADTLRLLDPTGKQVFSLKAGDPCVEIDATAGVYTVQHTYGGTGTRRVIFIHPAEAAAAAPTAVAVARALAPRVLAASDPNHPEYWAVYYVDNSGVSEYLTFTGTNDQGGTMDPNNTGWYIAYGCMGAIQAVAGTAPYWWPQDKTTRTRYLFDAANFFAITRSSDGTPSGFGLPLDCVNWLPLDGSGRSVEPEHHTYVEVYPYRNAYNGVIDFGEIKIAPLEFYPSESNPQNTIVLPPVNYKVIQNRETLSIANFSNNSFQLNRSYILAGNASLSVMPGPVQMPVPMKYLGAGYDASTGGYVSPANFQVGFRYFPNGLPPSMADASGGWNLAKGEVAMFSGGSCSGAAMISEGVSLPYPQPDTPIAELAILGGFQGSLQLGPQTAAAVYSGYVYQGKSKIFNQSGCLSFSDAGFTPGSIRLSTDPATIVIQTNKCEYCNLAGVDLSGRDLTAQGGVKLAHTNLTDARLSNSNLSDADLRFATLQGANLNNANLDSANLCLASLNADTTGAAASLSGAHLKDANLYGADLDGADFTYASFYSDTPQSCQPSACATYTRPSCASAYSASMNSTNFSNAYLAGVDMGDATANGAVFSKAILFGASFNGANLDRNAGTGARTDFSDAFLQGTDFTNAQVASANFNSVYVDSDNSNTCIQTLLNNEYTGFPGLTVSNTAGQCVAGVQQTPSCIQYVYNSVQLPATDSTNICPDGSSGPCNTASWNSPRIPIASSSQQTSSCPPAVTALCNGFGQPLNSCW